MLDVSSDGGAPTALNIDVGADSANEIHDNTFVAMTINDQAAYGLYTVACEGDTTKLRDCSFLGNNFLFCVSPDGGKNLTLRNCTFGKINPHDEVTFFVARLYKKNYDTNIRFVDCAFDGVDMKSFYFPGKEAVWRSPAHYTVLNSVDLKVIDGGQAVADAEVAVTDPAGRQVAAVKTDDKGQAVVELMLLDVLYDAPSAKATVTEGAAYMVTVTSGDRKVRFDVSAAKPAAAIVDLATGRAEMKEAPAGATRSKDLDYWRPVAEAIWRSRSPGKIGVKYHAACRVGTASGVKCGALSQVLRIIRAAHPAKNQFVSAVAGGGRNPASDQGVEVVMLQGRRLRSQTTHERRERGLVQTGSVLGRRFTQEGVGSLGHFAQSVLHLLSHAGMSSRRKLSSPVASAVPPPRASGCPSRSRGSAPAAVRLAAAPCRSRPQSPFRRAA